MGWGALLKAAVSLGGRAIKAVAKSAGGAVVHPQQTLKRIRKCHQVCGHRWKPGLHRLGETDYRQKRSGYCQRCCHWRRNDTKDWRHSLKYR